MHPPYLSGRFLLATPGMADLRFAGAVIAMCTHDPAGAVGLCVHRPLPDLTLHALFAQLEIEPGAAPDVPVMAGGPVEPNRGFVLHTPDWAGQDTIFVRDRWAITGTLDVLRAIADGRGPARWMPALGYTGWGEGQLEDELTADGWHAADGTLDLLWDVPPPRRWRAAWASEGIDAARVGSAGHA